MSTSIPSTCPHDRGVFIWLADGPWFDDPSDPDYGNYPWVHSTTMIPGHMVVCDLKPFATPEEAGELCVCSHPSHEHLWNPGPIGHEYKPVPCPCGCPDFRHRPEDIARWHAAQAARRAPKTGTGDADTDGLCARPGCGHQKPVHGTTRTGRRDRPCIKAGCRCPGWTDDPASEMPPVPLVQGDLFSDMAGDAA